MMYGYILSYNIIIYDHAGSFFPRRILYIYLFFAVVTSSVIRTGFKKLSILKFGLTLFSDNVQG